MAGVGRFGDEAYSWVSSNLSPGEYSLYICRNEVSQELRPFAVSGSTDDVVALLVISGTTGDSPSHIRGMEVPAGSRVASMRRVRRDRDRKRHHLNTDDTLVKPDSPGGVWKAHSYRDDHRVSSISTDAGLDVELDPYNLDPGMPQRASVAALREHGVLTPFSTGERATSRSGPESSGKPRLWEPITGASRRAQALHAPMLYIDGRRPLIIYWIAIFPAPGASLLPTGRRQHSDREAQ